MVPIPTAIMEALGMRGSMGRKGNPYGNAYAESFFKTLKHEEVYAYDYDLMGFTPLYFWQ